MSSTWMRGKNLNLNKRDKMYTLEQCLEQQKKVDTSIKHDGAYLPWLAGIGEVVEMCDHLSLISTWKKQPEADMKQAFMELIDVFAFALSMKDEHEDIDPNNISSTMHLFDNYGIDLLIFNLIKKLCNEEFNKSIGLILVICKYYFKRDYGDIYYYYMGKQTLTRFRQDNGYKDGTYIKIWGGREDNEFLTDALESGIEIDAIPEYLEKAYNTAIKVI